MKKTIKDLKLGDKVYGVCPTGITEHVVSKLEVHSDRAVKVEIGLLARYSHMDKPVVYRYEDHTIVLYYLERTDACIKLMRDYDKKIKALKGKINGAINDITEVKMHRALTIKKEGLSCG